MNRRSPRSGAVLFAALVCLLVSASIVSTMIAGALHRRVQLRSLHRVRQAELLVTTARDRALRQLERDEAYDGEVWTPLLVAEPHRLSAAVEIRVLAESDKPSRLEITVTYPRNDSRPVRRSGEFTIF